MVVVIHSSAKAAAESVAERIARALRSNPRLVLGLATGSTMDAVYARLVQQHLEVGLDFSSCQTFNLDEYVGLPADDPHSYRYYMNGHLFHRVNIDLKNTHLPDGTAADLEAECAAYERLIAGAGGIDLQLLGIGLTGHLGFNEPLSEFDSRTRVETLSDITREWNAALFPHPADVPRRAITVGIGTILQSRQCLLLATGGDKAEIIAKTVRGPVTNAVPSTALQSHPNCTMVLDRAAASQLDPEQRARFTVSAGSR